MKWVLMAAAAALVTATGVQAQETPRSIVPIHEVDIRPVGTPRYVIEVVVNGAPMMAGLDTGSTGLRLLPRAAARARVAPGGEAETYSYGSGVELDGRRVEADVAIGGARGRVAIQAIDHVTCVAHQPDCPAARVSPNAYGLMGSGQPGQGFPAIIGIRLMSGRVDNPFRALGVRRWIVHLPQRGGGAGALVLNPDARDLAGFVPLQPGAANPRGTVAGCVSLAIPGAERLCGPTLLDTGAPGLTVLDASAPPRWQEGSRARIDFAPKRGGPPPALGFVTGDRAHGAQATFKPGGSDRVTIHAGTLPFYAYDVLFDADSDTIAVRPNGEAGPAVVPLNPQEDRLILPLIAALAAAASADLPVGSRYVSLGSSYAAGPGVGVPDPTSGACARSMSNYARQVAARRRLRLVDAACSGATTANILDHGQHGFPAQIAAVTSDTRLVTILIGGNDIDYIGTLGWLTCRDTGGVDCHVRDAGDVEARLAALPASLDRVVAAVRQRAPATRIVLVGYLPAIPASGPGNCAAVPLTPADAARMRGVAIRLAQAIGGAAKRNGVDVVRSTLVGERHDACAPQPFVAGFHPAANPGWPTPVPYHPNQAGMDAIAAALDKVLG